MKKIQNALLAFFEENTYCKRIMPYAGIILYIYVAYSLITNFSMLLPVQILRLFSGIVYFLHLVCLVMCFAKNDFRPIFVLFLYLTFSHIGGIYSSIMSFKHMPSFTVYKIAQIISYIVSIIVYAMLSFWSFKQISQSNYNNTIRTVKSFCPNCGSQINGNEGFCGNCGAKLK